MGRAADLKSRLQKSRRGIWARNSRAWYFNTGVKTSLGAQAHTSCGGGCRQGLMCAGRHGCFPRLSAGGQLPPRMLKTPTPCTWQGLFTSALTENQKKEGGRKTCRTGFLPFTSRKPLKKINFLKRMSTGNQWIVEGRAEPRTPAVPAAVRLRKKNNPNPPSP